MSRLRLFFSVLLALLSSGAGQKAQLRVAFAYFSAVSDLSWSWRLNQGRIYMAGQLLNLYPNMALQTYFAESMDDNAMPPNCPPNFEIWAKSKMDIIFGTSYGFQFCMAALAPKYPDTLWFPIVGDINLTLPNWGRGVGNIHQTLFLAGMVASRETKTGKVGACMPIPIPISYGHLAAFAQGVAYANASVQVITAWSNVWLGPQQDVFIVQRMVARGVDVIWHRCATFEGIYEAAARGVRSIGFNSDFTLLAGESVLISAFYNWGPLFLEVARMVVEGKYTAALPVDLFPGVELDAVGLSDPSYLVHQSTMDSVLALKADFHDGTNNTFCGPMLTNAGKVVGQAGSCLTLNDIRNLWWEPWNVQDMGHYALPNEICHPGEQSHWDEATEKYSCTACPAGTYSFANVSLQYQAYVCLPCPAGTYAPRNSTGCSACPGGYAATAAQDGCSPIPMATAVLVGIIVGAVLGVVFAVVCVYVGWRMWKASADLRRLRKQFSNNHVAQECAEAIACFNLESVAWLRTCPNPNKIQQSFLQILEMLTMVKPYIPDHVLSMFTEKHKTEDDAEPLSPEQAPEVTVEGHARPRAHTMTSDGVIFIQSARSPVARGSHSSASSTPRSPRQGSRNPCSLANPEARLLAGEWVPKRCVYMVVTVSFASAGGKADEHDRCLPYAGQVLGEVIAVAKGFSATIDHVTHNTVALHWGLVNSISEGAVKATLASLEMGKIRGHLPHAWGSLLRLSVSVVQGFCNVATISSAGHSFFVVGGALLHQLQQLTTAALAAQCQCEVLVSDNVHQKVQYAVECMPRCFLEGVLFWQPLRHRADPSRQADEWMYELQQMEGDVTAKWGSHHLHSVFQAATQGQDSDTLKAQVARLKEQFEGEMSPQDVACLELLLAGGKACKG